MKTIPFANELLENKVTEWRKKIDNYISVNGFSRNDEAGCLLFHITPEFIQVLSGYLPDKMNQKIVDISTEYLRTYLKKYETPDSEYDVKYTIKIKSGDTEAQAYFVATAKKKN